MVSAVIGRRWPELVRMSHAARTAGSSVSVTVIRSATPAASARPRVSAAASAAVPWRVERVKAVTRAPAIAAIGAVTA